MNLPPTNPPTSTKKAFCPVISCLLKHEQQILILKRSKLVGSFQGYWSCVSGYLEKGEEPLKTAYREVFEETKIKRSDLSKVANAGPFYPETEEVIFKAHWFLLETRNKEINLDWEHDSYDWIDLNNLKNYKVVPGLLGMVSCLFHRA